jgi:hypothetical protein
MLDAKRGRRLFSHNLKAIHLKHTNTMPIKKNQDVAEKGGKKNTPKNEAKGGKKDKKGKDE